MARLKALAPRLSTLKPHRIRKPENRQEYDKQRNELEWRKWYRTARWKRLRWSILTRDMFTCQMCKALIADTSKLVADHKVRHRGNEAMFWNAGGIWTLCATCHSSTKQRQESRDG